MKTDTDRLTCIATQAAMFFTGSKQEQDAADSLGDIIDGDFQAGLAAGKTPIAALRDALDKRIEIRGEPEGSARVVGLPDSPPDEVLWELMKAVDAEVRAHAPAPSLTALRANYLRAWRRIMAKLEAAQSAVELQK